MTQTKSLPTWGWWISSSYTGTFLAKEQSLGQSQKEGQKACGLLKMDGDEGKLAIQP